MTCGTVTFLRLDQNLRISISKYVETREIISPILPHRNGATTRIINKREIVIGRFLKKGRMGVPALYDGGRRRRKLQ